MAQSIFMKKLRDKMGIIFLIVAILFIGMIIFQWGMNITGARKTESENIIAMVNNKDKIEYSQYAREFENQIQNAYNRGQNVNEFITADMREQAWHSLINRTILKYEFEKKLAAGYTGTQVYQLLKRNPPEWLRNQPQFQNQEGQFDYQKYIDLLNQQTVDWRPVEQAVASNLPYTKLQELISSATYVTMPEAMDQYIFENTRMRGEFLIFQSDTYPVNVDTSEQALRQYYNQHKDNLVEEPYIKYKYVEIPFEPSKRDSVEVKKDVDSVYAKLQAGDDFEMLAEAYSQDINSARQGGELGWFERGQLVPEFEEVATQLDSGEISEPVLTQFGWHIIRSLGCEVSEDTVAGTADTMWHLQHILFRIEPGFETADSLDRLAQAVREFAIKEGIEKAGEKFGLEIIESPEVNPQGAIPGIGLRTLVNEYVMTKGEGAIPDVVKSQGAYYVLQAVEIVPEKFDNFEQAKDYVKKRILKSAVYDKRKDMANRAIEELKAGKTMAEVAEKYGAIYDTTGWIQAFDPIGDYGYHPHINGALLGLRSSGAISPVLESQDGKFYIVRLYEKIDADMAKFNEERDKIRQQIFQAKKENAYNMWFTNLRKQIPVEDYRLKYFYEEISDTLEQDESQMEKDDTE